MTLVVFQATFDLYGSSSVNDDGYEVVTSARIALPLPTMKIVNDFKAALNKTVPSPLLNDEFEVLLPLAVDWPIVDGSLRL